MNIKDDFNNLSDIDKYIYYVRSIGKEYIEMPKDINNELDFENINKYLNSLCNEEIKEMMTHFFLENTKYISFKEFKDALFNSFNKFIELIENKDYYLILHSSARKSNYWCALLLFIYLDENKNIKRPIRILNNLKIDKNDINDKMLLFLDDASYSGTQLFDDINKQIEDFKYYNINLVKEKNGGGGVRIIKISDKERLLREEINNIAKNVLIPKILICTTYISDIALNKLKSIINENNIIYYDKMVPLSDIDNEIYNKYFNKLLKNEKLFREKERQNPDMEYKVGLKDVRYPIYFDHKIADFFSSYPEIYQLGLMPICDDPKIETEGIPENTYITESEYKYIPLFKSCEGKGYTLFNFDDTGEDDNEFKVCIKAFYKQRNFNKDINESEDDNSAYKKALSKYIEERSMRGKRRYKRALPPLSDMQ